MTQPIRPLILVRGFGGPDVSDEQRSPYQGFNDGTAYPGKRGENYIYEGFLLRALKSDRYPYADATNVVGYYAEEVGAPPDPGGWDERWISGSIVISPAVERRALERGVAGSMWVYRYYELSPRALQTYGEGLVRLIDIIAAAAERRGEVVSGVDIVAHSMGGLVVREALRALDGRERGSAGRLIHRVVTLGTPHRGIIFQRVPSWLVNFVPRVRGAGDELGAFDPTSTDFREMAGWFPPQRLLTVVGTNHRTYNNSSSALMNRLSSLIDEGSAVTNRSDGLVKQAAAQLPGSPRTFVHKCHGGPDSLVTSREAYEIAMRFFHATHRVRLWLDSARIKRGKDWFGRSEFFLGVSIKPRYVDFDLFHQSVAAENRYGPFASENLDDDLPDLAGALAEPLAAPGDRTLGWAGPDRLIWEGWVDAGARPGRSGGAGAEPGASGDAGDLVLRLDVGLGERDSFGVGFSDNVIFQKQYYVQAFPGDEMGLFVHTGEELLADQDAESRARLERIAGEGAAAEVQRARRNGAGDWLVDIGGTGFEATLRISITPDS